MTLKPLHLFFVFISLLNISFSDKADSLKTALANAKEACPEPCLGDTAKVNLLNKLGWELMYQNPDTSILLGKKALELAERLPSHLGEGLGVRSKLIANSSSNLGVYYALKGNYPLSLSSHFKALEIRKQLDDKKGIAASLGNIGVVYHNQGNYPKALKHHFEALVIGKELGDKSGIAIRLGNIGIVYMEQADAAKSRQDIAGSDSLYAKALKHYFEALEIDKELGRKSGIAIKLGNIGSLYTEKGRFKEAEVYLDSALAIDTAIGFLDHIRNTHLELSHLYDTTARYQLAYQHYKKYSIAKDSLFNEEKSKEIGRLEQTHKFEMEELEREIMEKERSRQEAAAVGRRNLLQYSSIFLVLFFLFGMFFFIVKIPLPEWMVELSTFVPFMILFEFILVLLDPFIENITGGEPLYTLLINALCAAIIFPIHNFFEKKLKARIYQIKKQKEEKYAEEYRKEVDGLRSL